MGNYTYSAKEEALLLGKTLSQTKQQHMTPRQALQRLKDGNQRFYRINN